MTFYRDIFHPLPTDDPKLRQPDIAVAQENLGWEPNAALVDGLKEALACFRETPHA